LVVRKIALSTIPEEPDVARVGETFLNSIPNAIAGGFLMPRSFVIAELCDSVVFWRCTMLERAD
jgi:hypothetical protein